MDPNETPSSRWTVLNTLVLRLPRRTLGALLTLALFTFGGLLAFGIWTGGEVSFLGFDYRRAAAVEVPQEPGLTEAELSRLAGRSVSPDEFLDLHGSHHDSLASYQSIAASDGYQFLLLERAMAETGGTINTTLPQAERPKINRLIQQVLQLAGVDTPVDGDRIRTMEALFKFQTRFNERAHRDGTPLLAPLGTLGRRTLKALQDSHYVRNQNA